VIINTGNWGCGAFMHKVPVVFVLQLAAARHASEKVGATIRLVYHAFDQHNHKLLSDMEAQARAAVAQKTRTELLDLLVRLHFHPEFATDLARLPRQPLPRARSPPRGPSRGSAAVASSTVALPWSTPGRHPQSLIGFYYPGHDAPVDTLCHAGFLGNFYVVPRGSAISVTYPADAAQAFEFSNAEAAFQFSKFVGHHHWHRTLYVQAGWRSATGDDAFQRTRDTDVHMQQSKAQYGPFYYGGFANNILAMEAVLASKFAIPGLAAELLGTRTAFLLEHNSKRRDAVWSDNCDGTGQNWLGILLMLLRDELAGARAFDWLRQEASAALARAAAQRSLVAMPQHWMQLVMTARNVLAAALPGAARHCA
jgi:hypothetical protein